MYHQFDTIAEALFLVGDKGLAGYSVLLCHNDADDDVMGAHVHGDEDGDSLVHLLEASIKIFNII